MNTNQPTVISTFAGGGGQRIGNAVMPKMMYHIAKNIKDKILTA